MRYFDEQLLANSRPHVAWWDDVCVNREWFHQVETQLAEVRNAASILPRDAWLDLDGITRRVMRQDEGQVWMADLMPLAKPVNDRGIGTLYFRAKGTPCLGVVKGTPVSARSGEAGRGCAA